MDGRVDLESSFQRGKEFNLLEKACVMPFVGGLSEELLIPQDEAQDSLFGETSLIPAP